MLPACACRLTSVSGRFRSSNWGATVIPFSGWPYEEVRGFNAAQRCRGLHDRDTRCSQLELLNRPGICYGVAVKSERLCYSLAALVELLRARITLGMESLR